MSLTLDLTNDFAVVDNLEHVRFTSVRKGGSMAELMLQANRRQVTNNEQAPSDGVYTKGQVLWNIPAKLLTVEPKEGDLVTDRTGTDWTVMTHSYSCERSWWDLTCISLTIAYDLDDHIDIEEAGLVPDASGTFTPVFPPDSGKVLYSQLRCKVQVMEATEREERGIRGNVVAYSIPLSRQTPELGTTKNQHRVKFTKGGETIYIERLKYTQPERAFDLPILTGEYVP